MKRSHVAAAAGVALVGVLVAVALKGRHQQPNRATLHQAPAVAPPRAAPPLAGTQGAQAPSLDLDALLADGSPSAWGKIASLYPASDVPEKRKVLQQIAKQTELYRVIGYLLATVGEDPTPPGDDPLLNEASALIRSRLAAFEDYEYGRKTMVMQKTDKRRWLLANALIAYAKPLRDETHGELKGTLQAKLIDIHLAVRDGFVRSGLAEGVRALGAPDAALILEKGGNVTDRELMAVAEEQRALSGTHAP